MSRITDNLTVGSNEALITPGQLKAELPLKGAALKSVQLARNTIFSILDRTDPLVVVVVVPVRFMTPKPLLITRSGLRCLLIKYRTRSI